MGRPSEAGIVGSAPCEYPCPTLPVSGRSARFVVYLLVRRYGSSLALLLACLHSGCRERKSHSCWPDAGVVRLRLSRMLQRLQ
jgi:hypothetical protein